MKENGDNSFTTQIGNLLKHGCGALALKLHGHAFQQAGWPDFYVSHALWSGWLELKVDANQLDNLQKLRIKDLRNNDVPAWCVRYVNAEDRLLFEDEERNVFSTMPWEGITGQRLLKHLATLI